MSASNSLKPTENLNNNSNTINTSTIIETTNQNSLASGDNNSNATNTTNTTSILTHLYPTELENQFILRMPTKKIENGTYKLHESTQTLRELLDKIQLQPNKQVEESNEELKEDPLKNRLFIELNTETRKGRVKFDDEIFEARLVDLPCIIETLKTTDKKVFYKCGDISQMLICKSKDDSPWSDEDEQSNKQLASKKSESQHYDPIHSHLKKYQWPHGITPPLKNVRRKRFRKVARKKTVDYADIEKEVKQLFRSDRDAIKIDYEVTYVEADTLELLDDDDDNNMKSSETKNINYQDFDDSSQEENTMLNESCSNAATNLSGNNNKMSLSSSSNQKQIIKSFKSKELIEESNLSSANDNDIFEESASNLGPMSNKNDQSRKNLETREDDDDDDEMSSDARNMNENTIDGSRENRTNFKDLFFKDLFGDSLSSSSESENENRGNDEDDENNNDQQDEEEANDEENEDKSANIGNIDEESQSQF